MEQRNGPKNDLRHIKRLKGTFKIKLSSESFINLTVMIWNFPNSYFFSFPILSIADVIKILTERMDETSIFSICVTRDQMLERGLKQWQRQKKSSPKNPLRVSFIGEAGIDNGALRKEFLTGMAFFVCYLPRAELCSLFFLCSLFPYSEKKWWQE